MSGGPADVIEQFREIAGEEFRCEWTGGFAGTAVASAVQSQHLGFVGQFGCNRVPNAAIKSKRVDQSDARRIGAWGGVERVFDWAAVGSFEVHIS